VRIRITVAGRRAIPHNRMGALVRGQADQVVEPDLLGPAFGLLLADATYQRLLAHLKVKPPP
jgi:hypothetical protein